MAEPVSQLPLSLQDAGALTSIFVRFRYLKCNPLNKKGFWNLNTTNVENILREDKPPQKSSRIIYCSGRNTYYHIDFQNDKVERKIEFELMPRRFRRYTYIMKRTEIDGKVEYDINTLWWGKIGLVGRNQGSVNISIIRIKMNQNWENKVLKWIHEYEKTPPIN